MVTPQQLQRQAPTVTTALPQSTQEGRLHAALEGFQSTLTADEIIIITIVIPILTPGWRYVCMGRGGGVTSGA